MRNKLTLLAMVVIMPFLAMAQYAISGKVMDGKTGEALPGAHIVLENRLNSAVTSQNGEFTIKQLTKGTYMLTISYVRRRT